MPLVTALAIALLNSSGWKPYPLGGLSFMLPSAPVVVQDDALDPSTKIWQASDPGAAVTIVLSPTAAPGLPVEMDKLLSANLGLIFKKYSGTIQSQNDLLAEGWPGLEFQVKSEDQSLFYGARLIAAGPKLIQVIVSSTSKSTFDSAYKRATEGLDLTSLGKGAAKVPGPIFTRQTLNPLGAVIDFPRQADESIQTLPGVSIERHSFKVWYGNRAFSASYVDIPAEYNLDQNRDQVFTGEIESTISGIRGIATPSKGVTIDGEPGLMTDFDIPKEQMSGRIQTTAHKGRLYTIVAAFPTALKDSPEVNRFFSSFHFEAPK